MIASVTGFPGTVARALSMSAAVHARLVGTSNRLRWFSNSSSTELAPPVPDKSHTPGATGLASTV